jgi:hypothetical protein
LLGIFSRVLLGFRRDSVTGMKGCRVDAAKCSGSSTDGSDSSSN